MREVSLRDAAADAAYAAAGPARTRPRRRRGRRRHCRRRRRPGRVVLFSIIVAREEALGNNSNTQGKTSDPYVLVKYGDQEIKTRVVKESLDPVWKSHVMLEYDPSIGEVELYVFDYENFSSDDLLGRITLSLPDPLPSEPAFCVLDREWLRVRPCSTTEQDKLKTFSNVRRSLTKAIRVFHDTEWLHKQDDLGRCACR